MDESGNHKQAEQRERIRWIVSILIPLLCALLSFCVIAKYTSSPTMKINAHAIQSLDDKKTTALELTAAATAASAAITLIPGDAGTPIADKLADLSSYFLIVVCAIYLEKYLVTITGLAAFKLLIPIGCILLSLCFGFKKDLGRTIACKLVLFGLAVYLVVPVSVRVADLMDATYGASMENTIASAKQATDEIKGEADTQSQESSGSDTGGKSSFWSGLVDKVEDTVTGAKVNLENTLNRFIEAIAVMLVTSCVIPILVLLFFVWLVKLVLGVNITLPQIGKKKKEGKPPRQCHRPAAAQAWPDGRAVGRHRLLPAGADRLSRPAARLARALQACHPGGTAGRAVRGSPPHDRDHRAPDGLRCIWDAPAEGRCRRTAAVRVVPADAGGAHRPPCSGKVRLIIYSPEVVDLTVRPATSLF